MSVTRVTTAKGLALNAKIQAGTGNVSLPLIEVVAGAGRSDDLANLEGVVDPRLSFVFESKSSVQAHAKIRLLLTNQGNPFANPPEPPLATGFSMQQIGFYAQDPDEGRILYQVFQFEMNADGVGIPYVPSFIERPWTYNPTFILTFSDAGVVTIAFDPNSLASRQSIWDAIEMSDVDIPAVGTRVHLRVVEDVPGFVPFNYQTNSGGGDGIEDISEMGAVLSHEEISYQEPEQPIDSGNNGGVE